MSRIAFESLLIYDCSMYAGKKSKKIDDLILADNYNSVIFEKGRGLEIYIVGGHIRDVLLGREGLDRDFVIKGNFSTYLKHVAHQLKGKLIKIGNKGLHRILMKSGCTLDFTRIDKDIEHDISKRDFTINAFAWSPPRGLIDLHNGIDDLSKKRIRLISVENLISDPLRIMRAYRLSNKLHFRIDRRTRNILKKSSTLIKEVKSERITLEFFKILNANTPFPALKMMCEDSVLNNIIFLKNRELHAKLHAVCKINEIINKLPLRYRIKFNNRFSQELTYTGLIRLEIFMKKMPRTLLTIGNRIKRNLDYLFLAHSIPLHKKRLTKRKLYDIFKAADMASLDYLVINNMTALLSDMEIFFKIERKGLLTSHEIMSLTGIREGKVLGETIEELKKQQFMENIKTKPEAIAYIKS